ncbi:tail fiber assembly protein [Escherichia coli]|uniref:tail fiber assembly protein n=1 Tax=Escherichia coli TaxID=562 RepID=UPI0023422DC0|nr:tail fiber assembly protein [Escherichia coli]MDC3547372.1 tail fiber assembly protein [Escherichia coli]
MKYAYSPSKNLFYVYEWESEYGESWPEDCVDVTEQQFYEFTSEAPEGKMRIAGDDGFPCWGDIPPPEHDELVATADAEKQERIDQANEYMNNKQWPGKAAIGRLKGEELAQYNLWLDYLDTLELVDTSGAPDIEWPTPPAVQAR